MLENLYIENYVLFDKQNINFNDGFIAVTGDTGAGKSLIIDALGYLCGQRLQTSIAKDTTKNTFIEGNFSFSNSKTLTILADHGIEHEDLYIVSREITPNNKSISRINGRSVTLSLLKSVFENELDIHSQSDNQYLLNKAKHLDLLDAYADNSELKNMVKESYKEYSAVLKEISDVNNTYYNEVEIDFIKSQLKEIKKIKPDEDEFNTLKERQQAINSFETIYNSLSSPSAKLSETNGVIDLLYESKSEIAKLIKYDQYEAIIERLNSIYLEVVDIDEELKSYISELSFDEFELNQIEERLFEVNQLIRRYGGSFELFNDQYLEMQSKVELFDSKDIVLFELNKKLNKAEETYINLASKLSKSRKVAIISLEKDVLAHLKDLHLENAQFKIVQQAKAYASDGVDDIEFMVAMNKGFNLEPLIKVASGGEISRLMLGLKVVFSKLFGVSTVIFDEIDTGVSGIVASSIGNKMRELSKFSQVFSVTHLAQVAACSNEHYYVLKDNDNTVGTTTITKLEGEVLIEKLALMATGLTSEASLKTARELYNQAQKDGK